MRSPSRRRSSARVRTNHGGPYEYDRLETAVDVRPFHVEIPDEQVRGRRSVGAVRDGNRLEPRMRPHRPQQVADVVPHGFGAEV